MIIKTANCEFLIQESGQSTGCIFVFSDSLEELQRLFGSSEIDYSSIQEWKYQVCTCKQDLANALILLVKEISYTDFGLSSLQQV